MGWGWPDTAPCGPPHDRPIDPALMNIAATSSFVLNRRHLLGIEGLSREEIVGLLDLAEEFVELNRQIEKKRTSLRGRTQINLFFESSTRTQSSFELAGKRLGADVMNMAVNSSAMKKGETLIDTAMTLNAMHPDILVVRHHASGAVELLAQKVDGSVINAGDGAHEHPTQALLDALTIRRNKGTDRRPDRRDLRRRPAFARRAIEHHPAECARRPRARRRTLDPAAVACRTPRRRSHARHARGPAATPIS